jgi:carboxyl-terminal processing protease
MKKILPILIPLSLVVVLFLHGQGQNDFNYNASAIYQEGDLQPTVTQKKVERLVYGILSNYHYRKIPVNDVRWTCVIIPHFLNTCCNFCFNDYFF